MTPEDIVNALETYTRSTNEAAMFVLQKEVNPQSFKAYKGYRYTLWYIDKRGDKKFPIIIVSSIERVTSPEEEQIALRKVNTEFVLSIFKLMKSRMFNLILGGSYDGDESISDSDN